VTDVTAAMPGMVGKWREQYAIACEDGIWTARPRDGSTPVMAATADSLDALLTATGSPGPGEAGRLRRLFPGFTVTSGCAGRVTVSRRGRVLIRDVTPQLAEAVMAMRRDADQVAACSPSVRAGI
jgi:hypothetical protein